MARIAAYWLFLPMFLLVVMTFGFGQATTGTPPFGSFGGGPFDTVNLGNLNVHFSVPVITKAGRGTPFYYGLTYDSSIWYPVTSSGVTSWQYVSNWGWMAQTAPMSGYVTTKTATSTCSGVQLAYGILTSYHDPLGTRHPFLLAEDPCDTGNIFTQTSKDGSGWTLTYNQGSVTATSRGGQVYTPVVNGVTGPATYTDTNGNQISTDGTNFTDTLGRTVLTITGTNPVDYTYTNPQGGTSSVKLNYSTYQIKTAFGCSSVNDVTIPNVSLISSIVMPDGGTYSFGYEPTPSNSGYYTGRIASVTLPTGGEIQYQYTGSNGGIECADGSAAGLTRTTPDGQWTYARSGTSPAWQTTTTDPQGNQVVRNFQGIYETSRYFYQGSTSGTLLNTVVTCYNGNTSNCDTTAITQPITKRSVTVQLPNPSGQQSETVTAYDSTYGMTTEVDEYDYGTGSVGSLRREAKIAYATDIGGIFDKPASVKVYDGSNLTTPTQQTTYGYDETTPASSGITTQHVAVSCPSGYTKCRGNLTTTTYSTQGSTTLTRTATYYDTGTVKTTNDLNGATTTLAYSSSGSCNGAFPTQVTSPITTLVRSMSWNCDGGVITVLTDENGKQETITYNDPAGIWRPTSIKDFAGNTTTLTYGTQPTSMERTLAFNNNASSVDVLTTLDGLGRVQFTQRKQVPDSPGSGNYDSVDYVYDTLGRLHQVSMPYVGTAHQPMPNNTPVTTSSYDALGRLTQTVDGGNGTVNKTYAANDVLQSLVSPATEHNKQRQFEYDGLGRLSSVCELTSGYSGAPSGSCAQHAATTGYWTKYSYDALDDLTGVAQNAQSTSNQQNRAYQYDMLGRITSETNPETNNQSYGYTYDTDVTCGTSNGDLVKRTDAVGNVTCYAYDKLHRLTSVIHPSGNYSSSTPARCYVYDSATVSSQNMANAKGRLAEAYTTSGSCSGSKITDLGFSYSANGQVTDVYESTPHSSGYYHVTASYWADGDLDVLSGLPGLPTMYYGASDGSGLDGEGRVTKVGAGSGQNPVTGVTYTNSGTAQPIGSLTQLVFGSADFDNFSYDPSTGRLTQYKFNVGTSQSVTGNLGWNTNGTLASLNITDQLNSANSQNCTFSHDDLARIASADCGTSIWNQSFSYDSYGNIVKTVPSGSTGVSFQATYSSTSNSTNRLTQIGSLTPSYDANGNLTNDTVHNYGWDAEGKMLSVDGTSVGLTYDALGRMVEQARGSSYTEIVYGPLGGKLALMNGQTLQKVFVPLPASATAVYTSSGLAYYRHADWLGSSRLATTPSRSKYFDVAYAPFGENYANSGTTDYGFTSQNQDTATNYYDFLFREYSQVQGRWMSPDPMGLAAANPANPQSWNRYAYVVNGPTFLVDPLGLRNAHCHTKAVCPDSAGGGGLNIPGIGPINSPPGDWLGSAAGWYLACSGPNLIPEGCYGGSDDDPLDSGDLSGGEVGGGSAANNGNKNCSLSFSQRAQMFGSGVLNLGIAAGKITFAAGVQTGTSGLGTALALYSAYSASGNLTTGFIQTVGAFMPNAGQWQQAANVSTAAGSIAGLTTLAVTGGDVNAATNASRWEGLFVFGFKGGAGYPPSPVSTVGTGVNAGKLAGPGGSKSGC